MTTFTLTAEQMNRLVLIGSNGYSLKSVNGQDEHGNVSVTLIKDEYGTIVSADVTPEGNLDRIVR